MTTFCIAFYESYLSTHGTVERLLGLTEYSLRESIDKTEYNNPWIVLRILPFQRFSIYLKYSRGIVNLWKSDWSWSFEIWPIGRKIKRREVTVAYLSLYLSQVGWVECCWHNWDNSFVRKNVTNCPETTRRTKGALRGRGLVEKMRGKQMRKPAASPWSLSQLEIALSLWPLDQKIPADRISSSIPFIFFQFLHFNNALLPTILLETLALLHISLYSVEEYSPCNVFIFIFCKIVYIKKCRIVFLFVFSSTFFLQKCARAVYVHSYVPLHI